MLDRCSAALAPMTLRLAGSPLALDEPARDLAGGVHPLFVFDGQRKKVDALARLRRRDGSRQKHGLPIRHEDCAVGETREASRFEGQLAPGNFKINGMNSHIYLLLLISLHYSRVAHEYSCVWRTVLLA